MSEQKFADYSERIDDTLHNAMILAEAARSRKLEKRAKKRNQLAQAKKTDQPPESETETESEDDTPLMQKSKSRAKGHYVTSASRPKDQGMRSPVLVENNAGKRASRSLARRQSSSESIGDTVDDSEDSVLGEVMSKTKRPEPEQAREPQSGQPNEPVRNARPKDMENQMPENPSTEHFSRKSPEHKEANISPTERPSEMTYGRGSMVIQPSSTTTQRRNSAVEVVYPPTRTAAGGPSATNTTTPAATTFKPTAKGHKTPALKGANPIKMVNQPKTGRKPWNTNGKLFGTLKSQYAAEKRGRVESTPDPSALDFVNGTPEGLDANSSEVAPRGIVDSNPYDRRETGTRRMQEQSIDDEAENGSAPNPPLQAYEHAKIPLVCFNWRNQTCPYSREQCRFLHRMTDETGKPYKFSPWTGAVPPRYADPPQTCFFWLRGDRGCNKSADDCGYAHENTGWICRQDLHNHLVERIDPEERPGAALGSKSETCYYWFTSEKGCSKPAEECRFAHTNTGILKMNRGAGSERIDRDLLPVSMRNQRRFSVPSLTTGTLPSMNPKVRSSELTCFFWNEYMCKNKPEECTYQHCYTGRVADPPRFFVHRGKSAAIALQFTY
jgi:chromo domain-containing protein 1